MNYPRGCSADQPVEIHELLAQLAGYSANQATLC